MDPRRFLCLFSLISVAMCNVYTPTKPMSATTAAPKDDGPKYYQLNKQRLREFWQMAAMKGMLKAKARASFVEVPRVERIIYHQCESAAKNVVELAKCVVRILDQRDPQLKQAYEQRLEKARAKPPQTSEVKTASSPAINPVVSRISIKPQKSRKRLKMQKTYSTIQSHRKNSTVPPKYYYSKYRGWVKNPIRKQLRTTRAARGMILREANSKAHEFTINFNRRFRRKTAGDSNPKRKKTRRSRKSRTRIKRAINVAEKTPEYKVPDYAQLFVKNFQNFMSINESLPNLENLKRITDFFDKSQKVQEYYKLINDENKKIYHSIPYTMESRDPQLGDNYAGDVLANVIDVINNFPDKDLSKFSVLSPRLFSIFPEKEQGTRLLSPQMFSFHKKGILSLPDLAQTLTSNTISQKKMLEAVLDVTGAGVALQQALEILQPKMKEMDEQHYPLLQEMSRHDYNWLKARKSFTPEQKDELDRFGFTVLDDDQMRLAYGSERFVASGSNLTSYYGLSRAEKEQRIEARIRDLAEIDKPLWPFWPGRRKRQSEDVDTPATGATAAAEESGTAEFITLSPIAFTNFLNEGIALEALTLSPRAFISEVMVPEALVMQTLSPRAFIATILSPSALVARVLSPTALRAEVLSPRALNAWILSPEAMIAEVLTPHFFEPRVLSPEAMLIFILSPKFFAPNVLSAEALGVLVLSPNILSPRIVSEEKMLVEILSPHILGGPHSEEEASNDVISIGGLGHAEHEHAPEAHGLPGNSNAEIHDHPADFIDALNRHGSFPVPKGALAGKAWNS